jgi:hypothetical protein
MEIELPERLGGERFERTLTLFVGVGAVLAALLVNLELASDRKETRWSTEASRIAVRSFEGFTTSSLGFQFRTTALAEASERVTNASIHATLEKEGIAGAYSQAEARAARRSAEAQSQTIGVPIDLNDIAATKARLTRDATAATDALRADVDRSAQDVDTAKRYARRGSRTTLALAVLASAGALFGLAGVLRASRAGWVALGTGAVGLVISAAVGATALLV